jgi:hypothetical protein
MSQAYALSSHCLQRPKGAKRMPGHNSNRLEEVTSREQGICVLCYTEQSAARFMATTAADFTKLLQESKWSAFSIALSSPPPGLWPQQQPTSGSYFKRASDLRSLLHWAVRCPVYGHNSSRLQEVTSREQVICVLCCTEQSGALFMATTAADFRKLLQESKGSAFSIALSSPAPGLWPISILGFS